MKIKPNHAKFLLKNGTGLLIATIMGYTYKVGKKVEDRIDEHYAEPKPE